MKWEQIKKRAIQKASLSFHNGDGNPFFPAELMLDAIAERRTVYASIDAANSEIRKRIANWDIRLVGKLRELFPDAFPASLRKGNLTAFLDDHDEWLVEKAN